MTIGAAICRKGHRPKTHIIFLTPVAARCPGFSFSDPENLMLPVLVIAPIIEAVVVAAAAAVVKQLLDDD